MRAARGSPAGHGFGPAETLPVMGQAAQSIRTPTVGPSEPSGAKSQSLAVGLTTTFPLRLGDAIAAHDRTGVPIRCLPTCGRRMPLPSSTRDQDAWRRRAVDSGRDSWEPQNFFRVRRSTSYSTDRPRRSILQQRRAGWEYQKSGCIFAAPRQRVNIRLLKARMGSPKTKECDIG